MSTTRIPVTSYAAEWNPNAKTGKIIVQAGGKQLSLPPLSAPEFTATLLLLSKPGLLLDTQQWDFELPFQAVGT